MLGTFWLAQTLYALAALICLASTPASVAALAIDGNGGVVFHPRVALLILVAQSLGFPVTAYQRGDP